MRHSFWTREDSELVSGERGTILGATSVYEFARGGEGRDDWSRWSIFGNDSRWEVEGVGEWVISSFGPILYDLVWKGRDASEFLRFGISRGVKR